jgi:translation initiation factor 2 beta subunit (eIF-2beta)/eIF-5
MPYRKCPVCGSVGRMLTKSDSGSLEYYRCDKCGQAWVHDKNDPQHQPKPITYIPNTK